MKLFHPHFLLNVAGYSAVSLLCLCDTVQAQSRLAFTDITLMAGTGGPTAADELGGHGAMWADADSDGLPDLYITMIFNDPMPELFFRNLSGGRFSEEGKSRGIADFDGGSHGACFADLDNDGDFDLFNGTTWDHPTHSSVNNIFRNDGTGHFAEVRNSGLPVDRHWATRGVLTLDIDSDGDLDLFCVTNYQGSADPPDERNELYRNEGRLKFTPIKSNGAIRAPCGQGATDTDFDGDGDIDIIAANRTGPVNVLQNDGRGNFRLLSPESIGIRHQAPDGITMGDVDRDGDLDMVLAGNDAGHLYLNDGRGTFQFSRSFRSTDGYMAGIADLDNDGDLDIVFAGDDVCYLNDGRAGFGATVRISTNGINDPRGIGFSDFDNDGDVDFSVACKRSRNFLYRNEVDSGYWLKVQLIAPSGQAGGFGAKVRLRTSEKPGRLIALREARSNNGYLGQNDPVLHFGLGAHESVDVEVVFADGTIAHRPGVAQGQTLTVDGRIRTAEIPPQADPVTCDETSLSKSPSPKSVFPDRSGKQWAPFIEWTLANESFAGNPFDVIASVTFVHAATGQSHKTQMFFAGDHAWKFRFTGTLPGLWEFETQSADTELDRRQGRVLIDENGTSNGFVTHSGTKWARARKGELRAFVPQYVMYGHPLVFADRSDQIDRDIETFLRQHGFTGFHVPVFCRWFDIRHERSHEIRAKDVNPDPRTFAALELLITKVHAAGGSVHFWAWGDDSRRQTPIRWGINGDVDQRLQRYTAARLGPLPGWTMGYGFDLDEWVTQQQIAEWRDYLHLHMGWPHLLGGRHGDPNSGVDHSSALAWNRKLDYGGYEHHRPTFEVYRAAIRAVPGQPAFSEDRFRIRKSETYRSKDYDEEMTRRGLWHSTMAGGVANIWGRLDGDLAINAGASLPYRRPEWIRTWADFFQNRFHLDCQPHPALSDGHCLRRATNEHFVFYRERTESIRMDLSRMNGARKAVAVDTCRSYREIKLGRLETKTHVWQAPYRSDWAIAVGDFER